MIRIYRDGELNDSELLKRNEPKTDVAGVVAAILADVRAHGDEAVLRYTEKFDGVRLETMLVSPAEIDEARARRAEEQAREALKRANTNRDVALASAELSRAMSRIKASKHKHHL